MRCTAYAVPTAAAAPKVVSKHFVLSFINEVLLYWITRSTLTTLFTIGMVFILGVPSLKQFTLPLIVGILAGGWSSVMLSTGLWGFFRKKFRRRRKI